MDYDVCIIGAGVVGLAVAAELSSKNMSAVVLERHDSIGRETSSRNSEVIHAGIYYKKDSLKAKLCVAGNKSLYKFCEENSIPHRRIGKYIIASNENEVDELSNILNRAKDNGVENIRFADLNELKKTEPAIKAEAALFSQNTGIIDSHKLMDCLLNKSISNSCDFAFRHEVQSISYENNYYKINILDPDRNLFSITASRVVNSAGLDADTIALNSNFDINFLNWNLHYCRGHYCRLSPKYIGSVNHLIYPVPQKHTVGLGIHLTIELDGSLKLGPDTLYLDKHEQDYSVSNISILEDKFFEAASRYLTGISREDIYFDQAGIRPKLQAKGESEKDFIIQECSNLGFPGYVNLIGIESPGLTSCLEIGRYVGEFF